MQTARLFARVDFRIRRGGVVATKDALLYRSIPPEENKRVEEYDILVVNVAVNSSG